MITLPSPNTSLSSGTASTLPSPLIQLANGAETAPSGGLGLVKASQSTLADQQRRLGKRARLADMVAVIMADAEVLESCSGLRLICASWSTRLTLGATLGVVMAWPASHSR